MAEFIEFCVNGRTSKSGKWDTVGTGKYLEGAKLGERPIVVKICTVLPISGGVKDVLLDV